MYHSPFTPTDPETWTYPTLHNRLKNGGTFSESFYRTFFAWTPSELSKALRRAHAALAAAGIDPAEPLEPIRVHRQTGKLTEGAQRRVGAERDLFHGEGNEDGLFALPWDREDGDGVVPAWFEEGMLLGGREGRVRREFRYPTIGQKFLQFAKERWRVERRNEGEGEVEGDAEEDAEEAPSILAQVESPQPTSSKPNDPQDSKDATPERKASSSHHQDDKPSHLPAPELPQHPPPRTPLHEIYAHVGWLCPSPSGHLILEKGFRSLRTWFKSPSEWHYDPDSIRCSLRLAEKDGTDLSVFWVDCVDSEPWVAIDEHAIAGAVERMHHRRGEVCFFVAREVGWVRGLGREERMLWKQNAQFVQLGFTLADLPLQQYVATAANETGVPTRDGRYEVPGISVSLQKILGEQMMRQRVEYRPCEDPCDEDDDDG